MNKHKLYGIGFVVFILTNSVFAAEQGKKRFDEESIIPIEEENFFEITQENFNALKDNFPSETQEKIKSILLSDKIKKERKESYLKDPEGDFKKRRMEQIKFVEKFPQHIKSLLNRGPNLRLYLLKILYQVYIVNITLKIFDKQERVFPDSYCPIFPFRSLKDVIDTVAQKVDGGLAVSEIVLLSIINSVTENPLKFNSDAKKAEFILVEIEYFQKYLDLIVRNYKNITSKREGSLLILKILRSSTYSLFKELDYFLNSTFRYLITYADSTLNEYGKFESRLPSPDFQKFTEYLNDLNILASSGIPLIEADCEFLAKSYREIYSACLNLSLIPDVNFYNGHIFKLPDQWNKPLINVRHEEEKRKKEEQAFLAELEDEEAQGETSSTKKSTKKKKKKQQENPEESSSVASKSHEQVSASTKPVDVQLKVPEDNIDQLRHTKIEYAERIQDWFSHPEKALTSQGYQGENKNSFKENLLKEFGKETIIFNHKFPKVIDAFLLDNPQIKYENNDDGSLAVSVPGYYNDEKGLRNFGFFEITFIVRKIGAKKSKKQNKQELERYVFHRFFRPVSGLSQLIKNKKIKESNLEKFEVEAAVSDDQSWITSQEQEGWRVSLEKEAEGFIVVLHPKKQLNYVLLLN